MSLLYTLEQQKKEETKRLQEANELFFESEQFEVENETNLFTNFETNEY